MPLLLQIKIPGHYPIDPDLLLRAIAEWQARRRQLQDMGGPPLPAQGPPDGTAAGHPPRE